MSFCITQKIQISPSPPKKSPQIAWLGDFFCVLLVFDWRRIKTYPYLYPYKGAKIDFIRQIGVSEQLFLHKRFPRNILKPSADQKPPHLLWQKVRGPTTKSLSILKRFSISHESAGSDEWFVATKLGNTFTSKAIQLSWSFFQTPLYRTYPHWLCFSLRAWGSLRLRYIRQHKPYLR